MRRFYLASLLGAGLLSACRIEETPQSYIDHLATPAGEIEASREELTDRLLSIGVAMQREDSPAIMSALVPAADVVVFGTEHEQELTTPGAVVAGLLEHARDVDIGMRVPLVEVGPRNTVAWFRTTFLVDGGDTEAGDLRFSGVFVREEGEWRLVQGHISKVAPIPLSPLDSVPPAEGGTAGGAG